MVEDVTYIPLPTQEPIAPTVVDILVESKSTDSFPPLGENPVNSAIPSSSGPSYATVASSSTQTPSVPVETGNLN